MASRSQFTPWNPDTRPSPQNSATSTLVEDTIQLQHSVTVRNGYRSHKFNPKSNAKPISIFNPPSNLESNSSCNPPYNAPSDTPSNPEPRPASIISPTARDTAGGLGDDPAPDSNSNQKTSNPSKDARKHQLRDIFKRWLRGHHPRAVSTEQSPMHSTENYTQLIKTAILNSPTCTRSTIGICEDIMKSDDRYRAYRRSGWQERVAEELMQNPAFQPIVQCRKGVIIKSNDIQWQLNSQRHQPCCVPTVPGIQPTVAREEGPFELDGAHPSNGSSSNHGDNGISSSSSQCSSTQQEQDKGGSRTNTHSQRPLSDGRQFTGGDKGSSSDGEDDKQGRKKRRFRSPSRAQNKRKFACIYHKHDPSKYGILNRQYLICAGAGFEYISELSRHLQRTHEEFICGKCLSTFDSDVIRRDHQERCKARLRSSQEARWAGLWTARFPGVPVPSDPYLDGMAKLSPPMIQTGAASSSVIPTERASGSSTPQSSTESSTTLINNADISTAARLRDHLQSGIFNGSGKAPAPSLDISLHMVENRVDCLEKRLPFLEDTVKLLLKLASQSIETAKPSVESNVECAPSSSSSSSSSGPIRNSTKEQENLNYWTSDLACNHINDLVLGKPTFDMGLPDFPFPDFDLDGDFMELLAV